MRVALYARVSTMEQSPLMQLDALRAYCKSRGWEIHKEYVDQGVSGATRARPFLEEMMRDAVCQKFKAVLVWKFDRLFRSVEHALDALNHFRSLGIEFVSLTEAIDTSTPSGKMVYTFLGMMAEFERDLMRERTKAGMDRARRAGHRIGRPPAEVDEKRLLEMRYGPERLSVGQIADRTGIPKTTVWKRLCSAVSKGSVEFRNGGQKEPEAKQP